MIKIIYLIFSFMIALITVNAQNGINFHYNYAAGGRIGMFVDSTANNVYYANIFPNQPNTFFNYLSDVEHVSVKIYFRKTERVENYRYTILIDDEPLVVNKSIDIAQLQEGNRGDDEILDITTLGIFPIKGKTITILTYDIQRPVEVYKNVFYGKPIPKAKIKVLSKRFATDKGVDYDRKMEPKDKINLIFGEKDDELTIVKDHSDVDFLYGVSVIERRTNKIVFESTAWEYGGYGDKIDGYDVLLPYVRMDKSVFKKSGDYQIVIQPLIRWLGCLNCAMPADEIESYTARYTLSVTLDEENFTQKEVLMYLLIAVLGFGTVFLVSLYYIRKRNKKKLAEKEQQKDVAKLQLNSIRSQLNPHFMFNALAGIQNLMNKNEIDHANKYLSKFARLTRNVLNDQERITLAQEKVLLDDYLQMEQLRFGFAYEINHASQLDLANIEIPSMLLQPFVENAVKHGIAQKGSTGLITIEFIQRANDLLLSIVDNGNGFDSTLKSDGLGLSLSERRIALLNSVYKENRFILAIQSTSSGTTVSLTLTEWL